MDHYGTEQVPHPTGNIRRFKVFDAPSSDRDGRVAGQEEVQNAIYRLLGNFVRAGRINKLILLHGPNGSAKSTHRQRAQGRHGALLAASPRAPSTRSTGSSPREKLVKGSIGFGEKRARGDRRAGRRFAHLEAETIDVRMTVRAARAPAVRWSRRPSAGRCSSGAGRAARDGERGTSSSPTTCCDGELCHKCRRIYDALLAAYGGDYLKVLRHVQVERFYISRRYQTGTVTVEPQMSVDAALPADHRGPHARRNLPPALQAWSSSSRTAPLVHANRGLIEYSDLLKRPLEAFKYLLGASETAQVPLEPFVLQLDEVLIASANEKHLAAFKELPDFASFKGRIELVRVPYLRRYKVEQEIYDAQITPTTVGKHVAPHATEVAAHVGGAHPAQEADPGPLPAGVEELVEQLTPLEKLHLYEEGRGPGPAAAWRRPRSCGSCARDCTRSPTPTPTTRAAAARQRAGDQDRAVQRRAEPATTSASRRWRCSRSSRRSARTRASTSSSSRRWWTATTTTRSSCARWRASTSTWWTTEVRDSMGLVSEGQYRELVERYIQHVSTG